MSNSDFVEVKYTRNNLDKYFIRTSIFNALKKFMPKFEGKLLDSGCGKMPYKEYLLKHSNIKEYEGLDFKTIKKDNGVIYDVKGTLNKNIIDKRL